MPKSAAGNPLPSAGTLVRKATADDAAALAELAAATFPLACPPVMTEDDINGYIAEHLTEARFSSYIADAERTVLLLEESNVNEGDAHAAPTGRRMVGYSMLIHTPPLDVEVQAALALRPTSMLSKFYIRADAHGSGLSHRLMSATLSDAAENGSRAVWLSVSEENERAQKFYAKNGFRIVGGMNFPTGRLVLRDFVLERAV
ncbi:GNAT family N-acetyltransferase [Arthrobacter sp. VKM Ac-2550]|uniref:GNAT family N-acetyltransferase n=1 Tax=Crystallibacter permensis TaxID=1938888 RepID=UPI0022279218|nr:GNAT family N-acetyltransferase [Arthrobacter sp. VKM Ac-2550]MCW2132597.1 Ribosomal protein S18 acetylase RimI [Arthrobacter sp. VKM Ac-2550]